MSIPYPSPSAIAHALPDFHNFTVRSVEPSAIVYKAFKKDFSSVNQSLQKTSNQEPTSNPFGLTAAPSIEQSTNQTNNLTVLIKLIGRYDSAKYRWCAPTRSQARTLLSHFDTLKALHARRVPNCAKAIEIKSITVDDASYMHLNEIPINYPTNHPNNRSPSSESSADRSLYLPSVTRSRSLDGARVSKFRSWCLIIEAPCGATLAELSNESRYQAGFPVSEVLPIALQLCASLTAVHKDPLPRRGINTKCVCYDPATCQVQVIDYGLPAMEAFENAEDPGHRVRTAGQSSGDESDDEKDDIELTSKGSPASPVSTSMTQIPLPHSALNQLYVHDRMNFLCQCFMSPEQTGRIYRGVDSRSDIYSLGVLMWVLLTGKLPFVWSSTHDPFELVHSIITSPIPSVRSYAPHVPVSLADIVTKCMDKQPNERYQSIPGLEADLFRVCQQLVEFTSESGCVLPIPPALSSILPSRWNRRYSGSSDDDDLSSRISTGKLSTRSLHSSPSVSIGGFSPSIALRSYVQQLDDSFSDGSMSPHLTFSRQFESPDLSSGCIERLPLRLPTAPSPEHAAMPTDYELGLTEHTSSRASFSQFPLGREDTPTRLFLSQQLYGREKQVDLMHEAISSCIIHGGRRLIVVRGLSGSGKSALIRSVVSEVCSKYRNVLVLSSKIDQYNRNLSMWRPIVNEAIINVFQQPSSIVAEWKSRILEAVGSNGAIVTELFPVLNRLIGPQPQVPDLPPAQSQQRAITTLSSFLIKFCLGAKRPMIFSFDDVQWAHEDCFTLLENFAKQPIVSHVCFIIAYRSEEVQETIHPAACTISRLRTSLIPVTDIECAPLTLSDFQQFVSDTLHTSSDKALPIAIHLLSRSNGNPFFARQILINLQKENQLVYHVYSPSPAPNRSLRYSADDVIGEWQLASAASLAKTIHAQSTMEDSKLIAQSESDIIQLVQSVIARLQPEVSQLLSLAAYLGSSFCLGDLALVSQQSLSVVSEAVMQAAGEELVELSYEDAENVLNENESVSATEWSSSSLPASFRKGEMSTYMFVHDRVQQACYNLIEPEDRAKTHLHFATVLLAEAHKSSEFMKSHMLLIADHVVKSLSLLSPQSNEAYSWSVFLLDAANKGYAMNNYVIALQCANAAAILIGIDEHFVEDGQTTVNNYYSRILELHPASFEVRKQLWRDKHEYVLDLCFLRAKLLYLNKRLDESISENQDALKHLSDPLDRHSFYTALQEIYTILSRPQDAFRVNRIALAELGFNIPSRKKELTEEQLREAESYDVKMENLAHLPYSEQLVDMLLKEFERKLAGRDILTLIDVLPPCCDPRQQAIARIASSILTSLYSFAWEFTLPFCLLVMMQMLDHGIAGPHAHIVAMLGLQLLPFPEAVRSRRPLALSDLSVTIMNQYPHAWSEPKTKLTHAMCQVFYRPFTECSPCFLEARTSAVDNGVNLFVGYVLMTESFLDLWTLSCGDYKSKLAQFRELNEQISKDLVADLRLLAQEVALLILEDPAFDLDDTDATVTDADTRFIERTRSVSYLCTISFRVSRAFTFYIMNQARGASEILDSARLRRAPGDHAMAAMIILRVLSNAMLIRRLASSETFQASAESKVASSWAVIDADMLSLAAWCESCPFTFGASYALARAEIGFAELVCQGNARFARLRTSENNDPDAPDERCVIESQYRVAVLGFSTSHAEIDFGTSPNLDRFYFQTDADHPEIQCTWFVAVAYERFSEFLLFSDQPDTAMGLMMSSYNNWLKYGCQNKLRQLTSAYTSRFSRFFTEMGVPEAVGTHPLTVSVLTVNAGLSTTDMHNTASVGSSDSERVVFPSVDDDGDIIPSGDAHAAQFEASRDDQHEVAMPRWWETIMDSPEGGAGSSHPDEVAKFDDTLDRPGQPEQSGAESLGLESLLSSPEEAPETSDSKLMFADFDLKTVMSATQAISKEIVLSKLLSIVMTSCVRITGAERAILFSLNTALKPHSSASSPRSSSPPSPPSSSLPSPSSSSCLTDSWTVDALLNVLSGRRVYVRPALTSMSHSASSNALQDSSPAGTRVDERLFDDECPHSVMNFVIHAQHAVILSDASVDPMFSRDPYIQKNRIKSLLCLPIIHRGGVSSCLYLDNSTSAGLFRRERLLICKLIAAQASISIDNARLYDRVTRYTWMLEVRVAERTAELEQASREAQEASKAKSMFLSTMSHEIRTPMNGVIGGCDLLASDSSNLTPEQIEVLNIIRTSADAMLTIINDILDLSKIEAGRAQIINTSFQVRDCVESTLDVVSSKAHSKGLEIQHLCDLNVPVTINSDYKRLTQCLFNLLSNAIKFTQQGEVVLTVSAEVDPAASDSAAVDAQPTDLNESPFVLRFCVRDTGCGIPVEYQHLLWQPFSQVHTEMRRSGPAASGSGLGLIITKHLVEMMGGQVGFESQYGEGSMFWFTIRCTGSDQNRPSWLQESADIVKLLTKSKTITSRPKCLLIHPFEVTRNWFSQVVNNWGIDVIPLKNVKEAHSLLVSDQPTEYAAVVVDWRSVSVSQLFDVETNQPVIVSQSNPPPPHTRDETPRLHDSFSVPDVYMRFTLDHRLLEELGASIVKHAEHCNRAKPVSVVKLGPVNLMSGLRARIEHEVPGGLVMHISTPIKGGNLYKVMRTVVQLWLETKMGTTVLPFSCRRALSLGIRQSSADDKSDDELNYTDIECIMIVEDNPVNRKVLQRMLDRAGFKPKQIIIAENGAIGVGKLQTWLQEHDQPADSTASKPASTLLSITSPAHLSRSQTDTFAVKPASQSSSRKPKTRVCMLLDLLMPVCGGIEACQFIRASPDIPPHQQPYIIALTANAGPNDREMCLEAQMDDYLAKPVTLAELTKALRKAARGRKQALGHVEEKSL